MTGDPSDRCMVDGCGMHEQVRLVTRRELPSQSGWRLCAFHAEAVAYIVETRGGALLFDRMGYNFDQERTKAAERRACRPAIRTSAA